MLLILSWVHSPPTHITTGFPLIIPKYTLDAWCVRALPADLEGVGFRVIQYTRILGLEFRVEQGLVWRHLAWFLRVSVGTSRVRTAFNAPNQKGPRLSGNIDGAYSILTRIKV